MSTAGSPIWLWRPDRRIEHEPDSEDYRCCCGSFSTERCFTVVILLNIVSLGATFVDVFVGDSREAVGSWLGLFINALVIVFAVLAINTKKPFWMQLFWIFQVVSRVLTIILHLLVLITLAILYAAMVDDPAKQHERAHILAIFIAWSLFFFLFTLPVSIWMLTFVHSFYRYIRDSQLWNEQQDDRAPLTV